MRKRQHADSAWQMLHVFLGNGGMNSEQAAGSIGRTVNKCEIGSTRRIANYGT
jgi:hypothetical protein